MQHDVVQAADALRARLRRTGNGFRVERRGAAFAAGRVVNEPEPSAPLGQQRVAVRQECHAERVRQTMQDDGHADAMLLGRVERVRLVRELHGRDAELGLLLRQRAAGNGATQRDRCKTRCSRQGAS